MPVTISIIIPTYNHRVALEKCLANIAVQTFRDFEVIVVDDGSTDGTNEWLQAMKNHELGIRNYGKDLPDSLFIIHNSSNKGAPAARNAGLQKAKGEYILFCDADVVMQPNMLQKMYDALQAHPEASYAYSSFTFGWKKFILWPFDGEKLQRMPYIHSTSLIRRVHFPKVGWDESLKRLQDWDLFLTMLEEGHTGVWIPDILLTITVRRGGISNWLPSFLYKFPFLPSVKKYKAAESIVRKKHKISML
ncbi:MAG: glycosyltransferase family A protein [bacterium]|nr:glycosyltransferase family A protein [bacterium]MDO8581586.1 glycosyltransferase family A protein [bacterium]